MNRASETYGPHEANQHTHERFPKEKGWKGAGRRHMKTSGPETCQI